MLNRMFDQFTRLLVLWVVLAVAAGYLWPNLLLVFKDHIEWLFAFTMVGIGAVLTAKDFDPVLKNPGAIFLGTLAQFVIMPLLGFVVAKSLRLPTDLAIGVIIVGSAPGAMASNVISYLAKADVPYSIAITSMTTFLAPILTPAFVYIFARTYINIPFWPMFFSIIKMVILPLFAGLALRYYLKNRMDRFINIFPAISAIFIAFICGLVVALNREYLLAVSAIIFAAVFLHNLFGLILGYWAGALYRFDIKRRRTLAFEVGMQNAGLGAVLALKHFSPHAALPNALFAVWCIITASILAQIWAGSGDVMSIEATDNI